MKAGRARGRGRGLGIRQASTINGQGLAKVPQTVSDQLTASAATWRQFATAPRVVLYKGQSLLNDCVVWTQPAPGRSETQLSHRSCWPSNSSNCKWLCAGLDLVYSQSGCMSLLHVIANDAIAQICTTFIAGPDVCQLTLHYNQGLQKVIKESHDQRQPLGWQLAIGLGKGCEGSWTFNWAHPLAARLIFELQTFRLHVGRPFSQSLRMLLEIV